MVLQNAPVVIQISAIRLPAENRLRSAVGAKRRFVLNVKRWNIALNASRTFVGITIEWWTASHASRVTAALAGTTTRSVNFVARLVS